MPDIQEMKVRAMENDILNHAFTQVTFLDVCRIHLQPSEFLKRSVRIFLEFFLLPQLQRKGTQQRPPARDKDCLTPAKIKLPDLSVCLTISRTITVFFFFYNTNRPAAVTHCITRW